MHTILKHIEKYYRYKSDSNFDQINSEKEIVDKKLVKDKKGLIARVEVDKILSKFQIIIYNMSTKTADSFLLYGKPDVDGYEFYSFHWIGDSLLERSSSRFKMNKLITFIFVGLLTFLLTACNQKTQNKQEQATTLKKKIDPTTISYHYVYSNDTSKNCKCPKQFDLNDSSKLDHIKDQFYKSATGHLYEKTWSQQQLKRQDTLSWVLYFNGYISQEVDPLTFETFDGWYAKDHNNIYYYRPMSGGMQLSKIDTADTMTFKLLAGHYKYAMDKNFFYDELQIIEGFIPSKTKLKLDNKERVIEMTCNNKTFKFELVD
jgi:hypothetical protein